MRTPRIWRIVPLGGLALVLAGVGFALAGEAALLPDADPDVNRAVLERWRTDPEEWARFRRNLERFRALPPDRQARLRQFDRDLYAHSPKDVARLLGVLERYVSWVKRLPATDRARLDGTTTVLTRITLVQELLDDQWKARLPSGLLEEIVHRSPDEQKSVLSRWRREERWRAEQQRFLVQVGTDLPSSLPLPPERFRELVELYFRGPVVGLLSAEERERIQFAARTCRTEQNWLFLLHTVAEVAAAHPLPKLPGPIRGTRYRDRLRLAFQEVVKQAPLGQKKHVPRPGPLTTWPGPALELLAWAQQHGIEVKSQPGPSTSKELLNDCSPEPRRAGEQKELRRELRAFLDNQLPRALTPDDQQELKHAIGHWPDYPAAVAKFAHKYNLTIPGVMLPGPPEFWAKFRSRPAGPSGLPDPPARVLRAFLDRERSRPGSGLAGTLLEEPAGRERVKRAYFQRYPEERKRLSINSDGSSP